MKTKTSDVLKKNTLKIKRAAFNLGMDIFGVANIKVLSKEFFCIKNDVLENLPSAVSMGVRLSKAVLENIDDRPTPLYLHHYRQCNYLLDRTALLISNIIQTEGYLALPIAASQVIDWENQRGHIPHKAVAVQAGLGWIGRNNLLVHPKYGAQVRLVSILTNYPLLKNTPLKENCGRCRACISVCPAGAIKERYEQFDHQKCFEKLKYFKNKINIGHYICGICVKSCRQKKRKKQTSGKTNQ